MERIGANNQQLAVRLLAWFDAHHRSLPWRSTNNPYHIWVSEIMLQQTRVETVIDYYRRFLTAFPTVTDLARAPLQEVLREWQGLGYYSRARNLHNASRVVVERYDGQLPETYDGLLELPGVGPYTAGAIASIAFGEPVPAVDGNVLRVGSRLFLVSDDVRRSATRRELEERLLAVIPDDRPGDFNQALMELGATVCTPRSPACTKCPVATLCEAKRTGVEESLPIRSRPGTRADQDLLAIALWCNRSWLVRCRPESGLLGGMWEFPLVPSPSGASIKQQTDLAQATLKRELGMQAQWLSQTATLTHEFSHLTWHVTLIVGIPDAPLSDSAWRGATNDHAAVATELSRGYSPNTSIIEGQEASDWATLDFVTDDAIDKLPQGNAQVRLLNEARRIIKRDGQSQ